MELSQAQLVNFIEQQLGLSFPVSTLDHIRVGRHHWFTALHLERRHLRLGQHLEMEDALLTWVHHWLEQNGVRTASSASDGIGLQLGSYRILVIPRHGPSLMSPEWTLHASTFLSVTRQA